MWSWPYQNTQFCWILDSNLPYLSTEMATSTLGKCSQEDWQSLFSPVFVGSTVVTPQREHGTLPFFFPVQFVCPFDSRRNISPMSPVRTKIQILILQITYVLTLPSPLLWVKSTCQKPKIGPLSMFYKLLFDSAKNLFVVLRMHRAGIQKWRSTFQSFVRKRVPLPTHT